MNWKLRLSRFVRAAFAGNHGFAFFSYRSSDNENRDRGKAPQVIYEKLKEQLSPGQTLLYDKHDLAAGVLRRQLRGHLLKSEVLVIVLTEAYLAERREEDWHTKWELEFFNDSLIHAQARVFLVLPKELQNFPPWLLKSLSVSRIQELLYLNLGAQDSGSLVKFGKKLSERVAKLRKNRGRAQAGLWLGTVWVLLLLVWYGLCLTQVQAHGFKKGSSWCTREAITLRDRQHNGVFELELADAELLAYSTWEPPRSGVWMASEHSAPIVEISRDGEFIILKSSRAKDLAWTGSGYTFPEAIRTKKYVDISTRAFLLSKIPRSDRLLPEGRDGALDLDKFFRHPFKRVIPNTILRVRIGACDKGLHVRLLESSRIENETTPATWLRSTLGLAYQNARRLYRSAVILGLCLAFAGAFSLWRVTHHAQEQ